MSSEELTPPVSEKDHSQGPAGAPVTLVEYGDYQCPYCGRAYDVVKELQSRLGDDLRFVFRNFPLTESHPFALGAAEAAEAAGEQGKFWEMHDMLYEHQQALDHDDLMRYARDLGLDVDRFHTALHDHTQIPRIQADFDSGNESGVQGTPTFFVNGRQYEDAYDVESLMRAIQSEIRV